MEWLVEAAKQVPALVVLAWVVDRFQKQMADQAAKSEERLKSTISDRDAAVKLMQETLAANNSVLGSVQVFMSILEREHKNAKPTRT